ncbi:MAG TPA: 2-oxo acid dehydrogenase subunit E2 [Streptosporangiaceae bacterium]|jgi:pyruvate dehydrogenase E2 component (dihydrolipoamide acetyltransferase)|nr:2-oxo acid dehydrogenase subunit E2 [Streptosporangiaceae bacterium]
MTEAYSVAAPNRIRRVMAARMRQSATEIPQVTLQATADAEQLASGGGGTGGPRVTVTTRLLQVVAQTLARHSRINSVVVDGETRLYETVNLGVATATSQGLLVPVIRDAGALPLTEIADQLASLRERAEGGLLRLEEMTGGTFTVTNLGPYGVGHFSPLVNPPQVAILGVGALEPRLGLAGGEPAVRTCLPLSLTFDHAAIDGAEAAAFLHDLAQAIASYQPDPPPERT